MGLGACTGHIDIGRYGTCGIYRELGTWFRPVSKQTSQQTDHGMQRFFQVSTKYKITSRPSLLSLLTLGVSLGPLTTVVAAAHGWVKRGCRRLIERGYTARGSPLEHMDMNMNIRCPLRISSHIISTIDLEGSEDCQ